MVRPPLILRLLYPDVTWSFPTKEKNIYLTFDDGPVPEVTPKVIELLKKYNAIATFFCIGENVKKHPHVYASLLEAGHTIGNHSYHHYKCWKVNAKTYLDDVEDAAGLIKSDLFRPPYGKLTFKTLFALKRKYRIIMWDVISCDFDVNVSKGNCFTKCTY